MVEIGIGMFGDLTIDQITKKFEPTSQKLKLIIEQVKLADDLGIDVFAIGEHHRPDYSVSSPEILLAALSSVTKQIKLASGVTVLSSADPVKVYQDFATIDLLSGGRAEIIAGRGSFIESYPLFGFDLKDYESLFEEKLDLLLNINDSEEVTWNGKFRPPLKNQKIYPRAEKPLPVWIAVGGTPQSVYRAAKLGLPLIVAIIGGQISHFKPLIEYYKKEYIDHGHSLSKMQIAVHSHTFVTDTDHELMQKYYPHYAGQMDRIGRSRGWAPYSMEQFSAGMTKNGALFMGDADRIADKIIETIQLFGLTRFIAHIDVGGPPHKEMMRNIELFGTKVLPKIRKLYLNEKIAT